MKPPSKFWANSLMGNVRKACWSLTDEMVITFLILLLRCTLSCVIWHQICDDWVQNVGFLYLGLKELQFDLNNLFLKRIRIYMHSKAIWPAQKGNCLLSSYSLPEGNLSIRYCLISLCCTTVHAKVSSWLSPVRLPSTPFPSISNATLDLQAFHI